MRGNHMHAAARRAIEAGVGAAIATLAITSSCKRDDDAIATLSAEEAVVVGAPIHGYVGARVNSKNEALVMVPDIDVWAHDDATGADSAHVTSNPAGYFQ